jgi:hypothetical protein
MTYNRIWRAIHVFSLTALGYHILTSFIPAIELWHPIDFEGRDLYLEWKEYNRDPMWEGSEDEWRDNQTYGNPEQLEMEQAEREIEPKQAND